MITNLTNPLQQETAHLKLALDNMNNIDKKIQKEANDYLENFTSSNLVNLEIFENLLNFENFIYTHFISVCLFSKIEKNFENFEKNEKKIIFEFLKKNGIKYEKNNLLLKNFSKSIAFLILKDFENRNFEFLDFLENFDFLTKLNLSIFSNIFFLLENSSIKKKIKYILESEILEKSEKIINLFFFCFEKNFCLEIILEIIENLGNIKFPFLSFPKFIYFFITKINFEISKNNFLNFEKFIFSLIKILEKNNYKNFLEFSNFQNYLKKFEKSIKILEEENEISGILEKSQNLEKCEKKNISLFIIISDFENIQNYSINFYSQIFSIFLQNFPQFLFYKNKIFDIIISNLKNNFFLIEKKKFEFFLMIEFLNNFLGIFLQEKKNLNFFIKNFWENFILEAIPFFIKKNILKNDQEFFFWKNLNFSPLEEISENNDLYLIFKENRENLEDFFLVLIKFLKICNKEKFYENLKKINSDEILFLENLSENDFLIFLESYIFFLQNTLIFYTENLEGKKILEFLLKFFLKKNYKKNEIFFLSISKFIYFLSLEFNNNNLEILIYNFIFDFFENNSQNFLCDGILSESLSNMIFFYNKNFLDFKNLEILEKKIFFKIQNFYYEKNFEIFDNKNFGIIENLINSYLKLLNFQKNQNLSNFENFQFFEKIQKIFSDNFENENNNKLITYIKIFENILNCYEEENKLIKNEILNFLKKNIFEILKKINFCFEKKIFRNEAFFC